MENSRSPLSLFRRRDQIRERALRLYRESVEETEVAGDLLCLNRDSTFSRCPNARHYGDGVVQRRDETVAGTTGSTTILDARLDVRIWSVSEGATQQQSGGVVLAAGASARSVLKTWVELHQHEYLANRERQIVRMRFGHSLIT